jgi:ribonuclease Z
VRSILEPQLVNGPFGDPGVRVDFRTQRRALLFDLGDNSALTVGQLLRVSHAFVSHAQMDHFIGFDRLLRVCLGRRAGLRLYGPPGFADQVGRRLGAYTWDRVERYDFDLAVEATEVDGEGRTRTARFLTSTGFAGEPVGTGHAEGGLLVDEASFRVRCALLDHRTPCLGFALEEKPRVHVSREQIEAMGLVPGPWLAALKAAAMAGAGDDHPLRASACGGGERVLGLGALRQALTAAPGMKIGYVTDVLYHEANVARIVALVADADLLFVESAFLQADVAHASLKQHLTARQAGTIARLARARAVAPFHFSPRYAGRAEELRAELEQAHRAG